jgi:hypothetical protein
MGFFYRRSIGLGAFRINVSRSGVGYSVGGRGFRVGVDARGRRYTSASIPGTGIGYRGKGCLTFLLLCLGLPAAGITLWELLA